MMCFTIHEASLWERRFLMSRYMRRTFHRYGIVRQAENKSALEAIIYLVQDTFVLPSCSGTKAPIFMDRQVPTFGQACTWYI